MSVAPVADQLRLLDVQALDTRLQQIGHARTTLPAAVAASEAQARLDDIEEAVGNSKTALTDLRRELSKAELDVEQVKTRAAKDSDRLNSGVGSAKDLQALQSELESLGRRLEELEEVELEVMERVEEHETVLGRLEASANAQAAERDSAAAVRDRELADLLKEEAEVTASRALAAQDLAPVLTSMYDRLRAQLGGLGAAPLIGNRCGGCRLELNAGDLSTIRAAAHDQIVCCEECGRILVRVEILTAKADA